MIRTLRDEIDQRGILYDEKIKESSRKKEKEFKQLQETIIVLRTELEKHHGNKS